MPSDAKRLGRGTAGKRTAALAARFSDDLLGDEQATFDRIDTSFATDVPRLREAVRKALRDADGEPSRLKPGGPIGTTLRAGHVAAMERSEALVQALASIAHLKATAAIGAELSVCEATLSKRFDGIADAAVDDMRRTVKSRVEAQMIGYRKSVADTTSRFVTYAGFQFQQATDEGTLLLRLFSPEPAGLRGFGGRGVWWQSVTDLRAAARTVSISTANAARLDAMRAFNTRYDALG